MVEIIKKHIRSSGLSLSLRGLPRLRLASGVTGMLDVDGSCDAPDAADCGRLLSVDSTSTKSFSGELARLIYLPFNQKKNQTIEMQELWQSYDFMSLTFRDVSLSSTSAHVSSISASILARS